MYNKINIEKLTNKTITNLENHLFKNQIDCLGLEVSFAQNKRRADILMISKNNNLIGFEIKSDYDNLLRLKSQIDDYEKNFDYTYIVTTLKYFYDIKKLIGNNIGIILYENDNMKVTNKAKKSKKINKKYLQSLIDNDYNINTNEIKELKQLAINTLKRKMLPRYSEFKNNYMPPYNDEHFSILNKSQQLPYYLGL